MRVPTTLAALGCAVILAGCGIKGPLYLPDVPPRPAQNAPMSGDDHNKQTATTRT